MRKIAIKSDQAQLICLHYQIFGKDFWPLEILDQFPSVLGPLFGAILNDFALKKKQCRLTCVILFHLWWTRTSFPCYTCKGRGPLLALYSAGILKFT